MIRRVSPKSLRHAGRYTLAVGIAALITASPSAARPNGSNRRTVVNFHRSVEVPGAVLGPGKYVMKLVDVTAQRRVVQFTNEGESHVFTSAYVIPTYRSRVSSDTNLTFYEAPAGRPQALRTWYYPGESHGQEFVYPHGRISQIRVIKPDTAILSARSHVAPVPAAVLPEPV